MITKMVSCQHVLYIGNQSVLNLPINFSATLTLMSTTILEKNIKKKHTTGRKTIENLEFLLRDLL